MHYIIEFYCMLSDIAETNNQLNINIEGFLSIYDSA